MTSELVCGAAKSKEAYVVVDTRISDMANYERYKALAKPLVRSCWWWLWLWLWLWSWWW
jgi:hypothetical protein